MRIRTRKVPATDTDGVRIEAVVTATGKRLSRPYDYASLHPHADVAEELAGKPVVEVMTCMGGYRFDTVE